MKRNKICADRHDVEIYKNKCDTCCADKIACENALQSALDQGMNIAWYQQKGVAITAEIIAVGLAILLVTK